MIYAYEALIDDSQPTTISTGIGEDNKTSDESSGNTSQKFDFSGLGFNSRKGYAEDTENYRGTGWPESKRTAVVLMSYNRITKEYKVFYSQYSRLDKTMTRKLDEEGTPTYGMEAGNENELSSFIVQKLSSSPRRYFFYSNETAQVYDENGTCVYQMSVSNILAENKEIYGKNDSTLSLLNVVMDQNYFLYMTMLFQSKGTKVDENTKEEELSDEGAGVKQLVYAFFEVNMSKQGERNGRTETFNYFVSANQNYEAQVREWSRYDKKIVYTTKKEKDHAIPTAKEIQKQYPDTYGDYKYCNEEYPFLLCLGTINGNAMHAQRDIYQDILYNGGKVESAGLSWTTVNPETMKSLMPGTNDSGITNASTKKNNFYSGYMPMSLGTGVRYYIRNPENMYSATDWMGNMLVSPTRQGPMMEWRTRTYIVRWWEDDEWKSEDKYEAGLFYIEYRCFFPETTRVSWSMGFQSSLAIVPSGGTGFLGYASSSHYDGGEEKYNSSVVWYTGNKMLSLFGNSGRAKNVLLYWNGSTPTLFEVMTTGLGVVEGIQTQLFQEELKYDRRLFLENKRMNFGVGMDSGVSELLNSIKGGGKTVSEEGSDNTRDNYTINSFLIRPESGGKSLYIAGLFHGLIKVNLDRSGGGSEGQLYPYPCYGIWEGKNQNSGYMLGFQSTDYSYNQEDLPCAKMYQVPLMDDTVAANLAVSCLSKDEELSARVLAGGSDGKTAWNNMLNQLSIPSGNREQVELYREFLMDGKVKQEAAVLRFYELGQIPAGNRDKKLKEAILACKYGEDIQNLILSLQPGYEDKEAEVEYENGRVKDDTDTSRETTAVSSRTMETETRAESSREMNESEKESQRVKESQRAKESSEAESRQQLVVNQIQEEQVQQYSGQSRISEQLRTAAGMTLPQWEDAMNEIAFNIHTASSIEEFLQNRAVRQFAQMAGISIQTDLKFRLQTCTSQTDIEELMAEYRLDSQTLRTLSSWEEQNQPSTEAEETIPKTEAPVTSAAASSSGEASTEEPTTEKRITLEEYEKARQTQTEAIGECRAEYVKNGYVLENGQRTELSRKYGTQWNTEWEKDWNQHIRDILSVFVTEK